MRRKNALFEQEDDTSLHNCVESKNEERGIRKNFGNRLCYFSLILAMVQVACCNGNNKYDEPSVGNIHKFLLPCKNNEEECEPLEAWHHFGNLDLFDAKIGTKREE